MIPLTYSIYKEPTNCHLTFINYLLNEKDIWNSIIVYFLFASGSSQLPSYIITAWPYTTPFRKIVQIQLTCHLSLVYKRFSWMITVAFWHLIFSTVYVVHSIIFNLPFTVFLLLHISMLGHQVISRSLTLNEIFNEVTLP